MARRAQGRYIHPSPPALGVAAFFLLLCAAPALAADTTPPPLLVYSPLEGAQLIDDRPIVFGMTERGATVTVNGVPAAVNPFDGTFEVRDLTLAPTGTGCLQAATITVSATDAAGSVATLTRAVTANQCVTHPDLRAPMPALTVALGQAGRIAFDLAQYFTDDGPSSLLVFSTYVGGAGVAASYSDGAFTFGWSLSAVTGTYEIAVTAHDRDGEVSDPAALPLVVVSAEAANTAPLLALGPASPEALPVGGQISFSVTALDRDGDALTVTAAGATPGIRVVSVDLEGQRYVVRVGADAEALGQGSWRVRVTAVDARLAVSSLDVALSVYDASATPGLALEVPGVPEVFVSDLDNPTGVPGLFADFSTARFVPEVSVQSEGTIDPLDWRADPLNAERTYWRGFVSLPATPGQYLRSVWVQEPGLPSTRYTFLWTVRADPVPPTIDRISPTTGSLAVDEGDALGLQWVGAVPDLAETDFEWAVDGAVVARTSHLPSLALEPGTHTVTLTATSPGGSSSASASITVTPRAGPALPPQSNPWLVWVAIAGIVVVGLILGGTEVGIYFLLAGLVGAIIDREKREKLLTHFVRGRIYQIIEYEPGVHLSELQRKAGVARGVCAYHLHALEKAGLIKTAREGMYLRFFPTKVKLDAEAYTLAADDRTVLEAIEARPGITEQQVAEMLGRPNGQVARSVRMLTQSGYLEVREESGEPQLFARTQRGQPSGTPL